MCALRARRPPVGASILSSQGARGGMGGEGRGRQARGELRALCEAPMCSAARRDRALVGRYRADLMPPGGCAGRYRACEAGTGGAFGLEGPRRYLSWLVSGRGP